MNNDEIKALRREHAALKARVAAFEDDYRATMAEVCSMGEGGLVAQHCACVPPLRRRIRELESWFVKPGGAPPADQCALEMMVLRYETCGHCGAALLPPEAPRHCHDCVLDEDDLMRFEAAIDREVGP
jgi:hypothetical protein